MMISHDQVLSTTLCLIDLTLAQCAHYSATVAKISVYGLNGVWWPKSMNHFPDKSSAIYGNKI